MSPDLEEQEVLEKCTFMPNITKSPIRKGDSSERDF